MSEPEPDVEETDPSDVHVGETVYDESGNALGTVRGFDEDGFFVTTREGITAFSVQHEHPGPAYGEGELMWRCSQCGAMGDLENLPEGCPECGAPKEDVYYWTED